MNRDLMALRQIGFASALALPWLTLSACGGAGDSHVASIPPPPPPPAADKLDVKLSWLDRAGTTTGTTDIFGRLSLTSGNGEPTSYRPVAPGEFTLSIAKSNDIFNYTLNTPAGLLPAGAGSLDSLSPKITWGTDLTYGDQLVEGGNKWTQYLGQRLVAYRIHSDGTEEESQSYDFVRGSSAYSHSLGSGKRLDSALTYDVGYSYVAMGEWSWRTVDMSGATAGSSGDLLFVNGDRTPGSSIPVSGTATYDAHSLSLLSYGYSAHPGLFFTLTADFGQRTMSTRIDQDYHYDDERGLSEAPVLGIHVGGSSSFDNSGTFAIPLTGSVNYSATNAPVTPPSEAVTGTMDGAFFGPHAEEVGGTFGLNRTDGTQLVQDAFVGHQH